MLGDDNSGSSLPEYTVLIALILIAVIVTIALIGDWVSDRWELLHRRLENSP